MQAAVQTVSLVQETTQERFVTPALRVTDLSLYFLAPLAKPAARQCVEGFLKPVSSGRKTPFYHNPREADNYSLGVSQPRAHPMGIGRGPGFRIESAESLINIPAFEVEEDLCRRQLIARRDRGGILGLQEDRDHLLLQAAHPPGTVVVTPGGVRRWRPRRGVRHRRRPGRLRLDAAAMRRASISTGIPSRSAATRA